MSAEVLFLSEYRAKRRCSGARNVYPTGNLVIPGPGSRDWLIEEAIRIEAASLYLLAQATRLVLSNSLRFMNPFAPCKPAWSG